MKAVCRTVDTAEKRIQEGPQHDVCLECVHPLDRVLVKTRRLSSLPLTMACPPTQTPSRTTLWRTRKLQLGRAATQGSPRPIPRPRYQDTKPSTCRIDSSANSKKHRWKTTFPSPSRSATCLCTPRRSRFVGCVAGAGSFGARVRHRVYPKPTGRVRIATCRFA
jgi:hypothetical protein